MNESLKVTGEENNKMLDELKLFLTMGEQEVLASDLNEAMWEATNEEELIEVYEETLKSWIGFKERINY